MPRTYHKFEAPWAGRKMFLHHASCATQQHLQTAQTERFQTIDSEAKGDAEVHMTCGEMVRQMKRLRYKSASQEEYNDSMHSIVCRYYVLCLYTIYYMNMMMMIIMIMIMIMIKVESDI